MKKTLLVSLILLSCILLTGCGNKSEENESKLWDAWDNVNVKKFFDVENDNISSSEISGVINCSKVVENYLSSADKNWEWEWIKVWDNIVVDYIWRLEDWTVFDTSIESIAKVCGKYSEGRDYTQWLSFEVWAGQMIKWFDNWVVWMKLWQTKTVKFGPDEWYGQRNEQYIISYTKDEIGDLTLYNVWDYFQPNPYAYGTITKITDKELVVDFNHELAGKDLIFDITIKSIN